MKTITEKTTQRRLAGARAMAGLVVFLAAGCHAPRAADQVCYEDRCFNVEVALEEAARRKGLQFRSSLPESSGMLFVFEGTDRHPFWMKDTLISLDMIWIDGARRVVHIEKNVPPCRQEPCPVYAPSRAAMYVLELNARLTDEMGLKPGDELDFRLEKLLN